MNVEDAPKASMNNRAAVEAATVSCCYFCFTTSRPSQIHGWTDEGKTALCPHCDVDAVLPGYHSLAELEALHGRWFTGSTAVAKGKCPACGVEYVEGARHFSGCKLRAGMLAIDADVPPANT